MKRFILSFVLSILLIAPVCAQTVDSILIPEEAVAQNLAEQVRGTDTSSSGFVAQVLRWYDSHMNYATVGALMALESSFIPFPSEVVIPPAVYMASSPSSQSGMSLWMIVLVGTIGAMIGAFINYYLARWLGRPIIYAFVDSKLGHVLQLSGEKMERAEKYFNDHGIISTLVGRLIPVIRQLISIPAGLSKMNVGAFAFFTFIGAAIWNVVLAFLGYLAYKAADITVIEKYSHQLSYIIILVFCAVVALLVVRAIFKKRKKTQK